MGDENNAREDSAIAAFLRRHEAFQAALKHRTNEIVDRSRGRDYPDARDQQELEFLAQSLQPCFNGITDAWNELMDALGRM